MRTYTCSTDTKSLYWVEVAEIEAKGPSQAAVDFAERLHVYDGIRERRNVHVIITDVETEKTLSFNVEVYDEVRTKVRWTRPEGD